MANRVSVVVILLLSLPLTVTAQFAGQTAPAFDAPGFGQGMIRGQISSAPGTVFALLTAELCEHSGRVVGRASVMASGEFVFDGVTPDYYVLRVVDADGRTLAEQIVDPVTSAREIHIKLPEPDQPPSGKVSVAELQHKVPPKALKEAQKAGNALHKNDLPTFIRHLEKALEIDPQFYAARRNLAKALLQTGQTEKALPVLQKLRDTEPRSTLPYDGLGTVYLTTHRFVEAEAVARKALEIDEADDVGHWVLGCSLTVRGNADSEALKHLKRIFKRFPRAHIVVASILQRQGRKQEARQELQAYLESGDPGARAEVEQALEQMP